MSSITFGGLASGLDTKAIISALLAVEARPMRQLSARKKTFQNQRNLFGDLEEKLESLRKKADSIRKSDSVLSFKAELDNENFLSVSAESGANPGVYRIQVDQLATAQVSSSTERTLTGPDEKSFGSGTLTFTVDGNAVDIDLDGEFNSLQDVAGAINGSDELNLNASVLETKSGKYRLVISSKSTGSEQAFTITGDQGMADIAAELSSNTTAANNAKVRIDGIAIERSSNTIGDAIQGVSFSLKKSDAGTTTTTLTVSPDGSATGEKLKEFVDAYNEIVDFVEGQSNVDGDGKASSALFGDSGLRSIRSTLRSIVGSNVTTTGNSAYSMLSQIGITSDRDGRLTLDQTKFDEAVSTDEGAIKKLFSDKTNGIAQRLYDTTDGYLDTVDGFLFTRRKGIDDRIGDIDDQLERMERRLDNKEIQLQNKYANLEVLLGRLQSQGGALGSLQNLNSSRK